MQGMRANISCAK